MTNATAPRFAIQTRTRISTVAAVGSTILLKLLSRRGRIVRTLALASAAAATTFVRNQFFAKHKTTTYSWSRDVDRTPTAGDHHV